MTESLNVTERLASLSDWEKLSVGWRHNLEAIDNAMYSGQFSSARKLAALAIERHADEPHLIANAHLRSLAAPIYAEAYERFEGVRDEEFLSELPLVFPNAMELMCTLVEHRHANRITKGLAAELAFFGLINDTREQSEAEDSEYFALPATIREDMGDLPIDGVRNGLDFKVYRCQDLREIPLQVKYSRVGLQRWQYQEDIMKVSLEEIAGTADNIGNLQYALIDEANGARSGASDYQISTARRRLYSRFDNYLKTDH